MKKVTKIKTDQYEFAETLFNFDIILRKQRSVAIAKLMAGALFVTVYFAFLFKTVQFLSNLPFKG